MAASNPANVTTPGVTNARPAAYEDHPIFQKVPDQAKLWRYMDFTKFVSLLEREALFFARADKLDDPFEGSLSTPTLAALEKEFADLHPDKLGEVIGGYKEWRRCTVLNCWNMSDYESAALWKQYLEGSEGVAIQSTFGRLTESFVGGGDLPVYVGTVQYIDYETDIVPVGNAMHPFLRKRKSFEHENEVRAVMFRVPTREGRIDWGFEPFGPDGEYVSIDIDRVVQAIHVSPTAPGWFKALVESVVARYGLDKPVINSSLADRPVF
jgi:hypothetical protein